LTRTWKTLHFFSVTGMASPDSAHSGTPTNTPNYGASESLLRRRSFVEEAADSLARNFATYSAFLFVGCGCGWLTSDSIDQLLANEQAVQRHGKMFGTLSDTSGIVGLVSGILFFLYLLTFRTKPMLKHDQCTCIWLTMCNITALFSLAVFWQADAPTYPVVVVCNMLGVLTAQASYYFIFPMVATFYAGWLIAPVRTGTDLSTLLTALLGEMQNPTGQHIRFSSACFFATLALIACLGLVAWFVIIGNDIGLKKKTSQDNTTDDSPVHEHAYLQLGCPLDCWGRGRAMGLHRDRRKHWCTNDRSRRVLWNARSRCLSLCANFESCLGALGLRAVLVR